MVRLDSFVMVVGNFHNLIETGSLKITVKSADAVVTIDLTKFSAASN